MGFLGPLFKISFFPKEAIFKILWWLDGPNPPPPSLTDQEANSLAPHGMLLVQHYGGEGSVVKLSKKTICYSVSGVSTQLRKNFLLSKELSRRKKNFFTH